MIYRRFLNLPTWRFRSPLDELFRMRQHLDQMFEDTSAPYRRPTAGVFPLINLTEDKNNYYVRAELPGMKADALDIQVTANNLAISGERKIDAAEEGARYHRREREAGSFSRMIGLPGDINPDKASSTGYIDCILQQVEEYLGDFIPVKKHLRKIGWNICFYSDPFGFQHTPVEGDDFIDEKIEIIFCPMEI